MRDVPDAQAIVLSHARPLPSVATPLGPAALGRVLAEDVASDLDMPPYDKAMMDGYAVRAADAPGELEVVEEITAGRTPTRPVAPGQAARIMTGAPLPIGVDAVIMVEECEAVGEARVRVPAAAAGQNIQPRARELRRGEIVL